MGGHAFLGLWVSLVGFGFVRFLRLVWLTSLVPKWLKLKQLQALLPSIPYSHPLPHSTLQSPTPLLKALDPLNLSHYQLWLLPVQQPYDCFWKCVGGHSTTCRFNPPCKSVRAYYPKLFRKFFSYPIWRRCPRSKFLSVATSLFWKYLPSRLIFFLT